ncbi:uncharacterized protein TM35_000381770 [Trypanosoma theileri]|uniref:Uncharacterized protein n=1 Tax=Trypanosoma theileri TaxID=67003 RepID=A0A1X0NK22_9TRYP|nr:uncharacterized protein TM35_000381770 [Trypanosoma theileri]ORC85102.1 hypothetical protein TM35_000381770 [Trypanosoma theileri]
MKTGGRTNTIRKEEQFSGMDASTQHRGFLPFPYSNGYTKSFNSKYATSKQTREITRTTRGFPIRYTPPGYDFNKRGNIDSSKNQRSVHRGVGIRGQPHRETYVDPYNMGTARFNNAPVHRVHYKKTI